MKKTITSEVDNTGSNLVDLINFVKSELKREKAEALLPLGQRKQKLPPGQVYASDGRSITL